jgi:hypothetical protein
MPIYTNPEMDTSDQWDVACVLFSNKDLMEIAFLYETQNNNLLATLREPRDDNLAARFTALRNCNDVLKPNFLLRERLLNVIKSVLIGRSVNEMAVDDYNKIASRYNEWLSLPLNSGWRSAAYTYRDNLFRPPPP